MLKTLAIANYFRYLYIIFMPFGILNINTLFHDI